MSFCPKNLLSALAVSVAFAGSVSADGHAPDWLTMSYEEFARTYADQAFSSDPEARYEVAWMLFARLNQQIESSGDVVSVWEAWPSDSDTFNASPSFTFGEKERDDPHFVTSKKILAGEVDTADQGVGAEEVTRSPLGYEYLVGKGLNTAAGVTQYLSDGNTVQMPIGSVEIKARWEAAGTPETEGAYEFLGGQFALTGLHIMFKMAETPADVYQSPDPSWFWTTFEFDKNPGLKHVRSDLIDQPHDSATTARDQILSEAGLGGSAFELYSPNGTQITFDEGGSFLVLGHTMMEAFAFLPDGSSTPPADATGWNSSCHSCHATASWNVSTGQGNSMPMPVGNLTAEELAALKGYTPVDFMWPIVFNAR